MKKSWMMIWMSCALIFATASCDDGEDGSSDSDTSTLRFGTQMGAEPSKASHTCALADMRMPMHALAVSSGLVEEGGVDDMEWHVIYDNPTGEALASEIEVEMQLPLGTYNNYKFTFGNDMAWILDCAGDIVEIPGQMHGDDETVQDTVNNENGCWGYDEDGKFHSQAPGEVMGGFEIRTGTITNVTMRFNASQVIWDDADESGDWSEGDSFDFIQDEGTETMADMVVTYE